MTTLFGDRADFGIEAGIEPGLVSPSAVWGHMCVWCRGVPLGDISDRHCGLYDAYSGFRDAVIGIDDLWASELADLDDVAAWNFLDGLLYGFRGDVEVFDDRTLAQCELDSSTWSRFIFLTNWGESFDRYKAFIMRPPDGAVRILSRGPQKMRRSVEVSRAGFIGASEGFVRWFDEEDRRLQATNV